MKDIQQKKQIKYIYRARRDFFVLVILLLAVYGIFIYLRAYDYARILLDNNNMVFLGEFLLTLAAGSLGFAVYAARRRIDLKREIHKNELHELKHKNSRSQYHKFFDSVPDFIVQIDNNNRIIWANYAAIEYNDRTVGAVFNTYIYPYGESTIACDASQKAVEEGVTKKVIKYFPPTNEHRESYVEHTFIPFKNLEGSVELLMSISRDITERMQVEESRSRLASIIETSDDAIFVVALDGSIHSWNIGAERIFGYSAAQVVGQPLTILDHLIHFETLIRIPQNSENEEIKDKIQHFEKIQVVPFNSNQKIFVSLTIYPFVDETGKVLGFSTIARDITSSINAEEALRESQSRFKQLAETIQDAFWLIDWSSKRILYVSPAYEKIWGRNPGEFYNADLWIGAVVDEDKEKVALSFSKMTDNNGMMVEFRILRNDGSIKWIRERAFPVYDEYGYAYRVAGIAQDISDYKFAEDALKESETRFKELYQNMSSGVTVYETKNGSDFFIKDINKAAEKIEQINAVNIFGLNLKTILKDKKNWLLIEKIKEVWTNEKPISYLFNYYENNEIVAWRQNYIYKLPSGEVVSIFDDVTEKIRQDAALRDSEERYRSFVQSFKGIAFRWNIESLPIFIHGAVEEITGYSELEFISGKLNWNNIVYAEDRAVLAIETSKINTIPHYENEFEYRIIRKDGSQRWVNESLQNMCGMDGRIQYIQATLYDITQRKNAEEELVRSRRQLRNLALHLDSVREEERKQIAFEIHDELGYALTAVKLDLAWLVKKIDLSNNNLSVRTTEMSELIETTIQKVRTISSQLRPSILDHFGLVAAIEWQAKEFQRRTSVRCRVMTDPKDLIIKEVLATPVFRIYQEALTNIARYAKSSRVDVFLTQTTEQIELKVIDNGIGIPEDKIFDQNSFGLLGIREKAKSMGGRVVIKRGSEGGTEVNLLVPLNSTEVEND